MKLKTYMDMLNYVDCREAQIEKLPDACHSLVDDFKP